MAAALPCTVVSLLGLAGFGVLLAVHLTSADQITAVALALIAALTLPHTCVVAWLDRTTWLSLRPPAGEAGGQFRVRRA
jgi:hypothetical protein